MTLTGIPRNTKSKNKTILEYQAVDTQEADKQDYTHTHKHTYW